MRIISHRGYWKDSIEKNKEIAFERSFKLGFGTETDFRDLNGKLVVSHDVPTASSVLPLSRLISTYKKYDNSLPLAINIKADGLQSLIKQMIEKMEVKEYFVFDMSIPDTLGYIKLGIDFYIRQSEYEKDLPFYSEAKGIWLDAFGGIWYDEAVIKYHLRNGKRVAIVSAELHKRDYVHQWETIKSWTVTRSKDVILCTDLPEIATEFFLL